MLPAVASLAEQIRAASAQGRALNPRGGGTKAFAHDSPASQALDTRMLQGIVSYEPTELVVTAWAGTPLTELESVLAGQEQYLPFEPPHLGAGATLGGMVAAGISGPARASAGAVRDYVLGVQMLNGRGECLQFGGQVMKNVAGYDLSRLMAGSWGSLGLLTQVSLKVLPLAPAETTLCFPLGEAEALAALQTWGGQPLPLNASRWEDGRLWVRLRGAVAAVSAASDRLLSQWRGERVDDTLAHREWADCREQRLAFFQPPQAHLALWRLSVAPAAPRLDVPGPTLIEWHGGQRWVWAPADAGDRLHPIAAQAGGHAMLWRLPADGSGNGLPRRSPLPAALARIELRLKAEFDPAGVFNPGQC